MFSVQDAKSTLDLGPIVDLPNLEAFYVENLGCQVGRRAEDWVDLNMMGHQFVLHLDPSLNPKEKQNHKNEVDGKHVPVPHYGVILTMDHWQVLAAKLKASSIELAGKHRFASTYV